MAIELTAVLPCFLCGFESDMNVSLDGRIEGICSVCFERSDADDQLPYLAEEGDDDG